MLVKHTNGQVSNNLNLLEVFWVVNSLAYLKYTGSFFIFILWGLTPLLFKAIGIKACNRYNVGYFHSEELLESMVALKEQDYDKYARKMKKYLKWELIILDDFLLHTITDEREIKILFELLEKRNEQRKSTIVCSQRDPDNWKAMILNDEVSANSIMKRATKHYTIKINTR